MPQIINISELIGKTLIRVWADDELIRFETKENRYEMYHKQDCCEHVYVSDICGELQDLVGTPILLAEEVSSSNKGTDRESYEGTSTWTFYKLSTIKGDVTISWLGTSNGYYSESVDLYLVE